MPLEPRSPRRKEPIGGTRTMLGNREPLCPKLDRVARLAKERPRMRFTSLAHLMDEEFLRGAWQRVRKDGAVGGDQQSAEDYASNLDATLSGVCERLGSGRYKAPPVRRVWIPKDGGKAKAPRHTDDRGQTRSASGSDDPRSCA